MVSVVLGGACGESSFVVDSLPIAVDYTSGVPIALVRTPELGDELRPVVIDTGSPLTLVDAPRDGLERVPATLEIFRPTPLGGSAPVPRARFLGAALLLAPVGEAGDGATAIDGVLGGDLMSRAAVRFDPARGEIRLLPDFAGSAEDHENDCRALFGGGARGGGKVELETGVVFEYPATRLVVPACLAPPLLACASGSPPAGGCEPGTDAALVIATGTFPSVLSRAAWKRATGQSDADIDLLPQAALHLPGTRAVEMHPRGVLPGIALVDDEREQLGPCGELDRARACDVTGSCAPVGVGSSAAAASIELVVGLPVAILPDTHPVLQGLRNELRPAIADVDGLLGMSALSTLVVDVDYPAARIIAECADDFDPACLQRPRATSARRAELTVRGCLPPAP